MNRIEIKPGIYSVGVVDWNAREFHGYAANQGATYNAYLIVDEKVVLIDNVKEAFADEFIKRITDIVPMERIDYVISNHGEMDHSGSLPFIMKLARNAKLISLDGAGVSNLKAEYPDSAANFNFMPVKSMDTLSIGKHTLKFIATPMLHWPDNMVTYCVDEKILFSNDAFGQHIATSGRFDDENSLSSILNEAQKYYANILMPYGVMLNRIFPVIAALDIDIIAPSHGVIWRSNVKDILAAYKYYCDDDAVENKALVIYDSMWHSTEKMAKAIVEGFAEKKVFTELIDLKVNELSDIMLKLHKAKYIAVGSPTFNRTIMPNVAAFLCYLKGLTGPKNKSAFAFGSYGWGGQSIPEIDKALRDIGYTIMLEPVKNAYVPTDEFLKDLRDRKSVV